MGKMTPDKLRAFSAWFKQKYKTNTIILHPDYVNQYDEEISNKE